MAFSIDKGLIAVQIDSSGTYRKLDKYIKFDGIESTPDMIQDLDSYRNANGKLKRTTLSHTASKIEFDTKFMEYKDMHNLIHILKLAMKANSSCSVKERKVHVRYYDEWIDGYKKGYFYIPEITFSYHGTYTKKPRYNSTKISFIEY